MDVRRYLLRPVWDSVRTTRHLARRLVTSPRLAIEYARFRSRLRRHDWSGLRSMLRPCSELAMRANDFRMLTELGNAALRLEEYQLGVELLHAARLRDGSARTTDWRGEDISDATLVVHLMEKASQGVATGMAMAGHIRAANTRAERTILVVEQRMVPLFQRTMPDVTVLPFGADLRAHVRERIVTASMNDLQVVLGYDAATIGRLHLPLVADPAQTKALRNSYRGGSGRPLIGISWWSSHYGKDLPSPRHWARLVEAIPAQFVSLQYGKVADELAVLHGGDPQRIIVDSTVDQLADMDRFASQVAALDLVVSISNSGAHLAGSLGQRMILIRDDLFRRNWSYLSRKVPWYPATTVIGKDDRSWDAVMDEIIALAETVVLGCTGRSLERRR